ncbi:MULTISPECIES: hypothetical protein [unclassified Leptolyngbya]|uniref:hypothetical protein n=1 Tax=unclassified Leptolyngbya TaxID=2650499 RepID=UPI001689E266|nr:MULTISPECIES: hypothetical protein [unclassified Leptolyngbya]MBD1909494.1 hypothetical protein [Leptolyngbya sp. FACHB-8]MBD2159021.1 hypothetical protein [Leptolyngbya sp. FACHB-16]
MKKISNLMVVKYLAACVCIAATMTLVSCNNSTGSQADAGDSSPSVSAAANEQVEKVKPAIGTGNVQGQVFYNEKLVENIEVKLCETFNQFVGGCDGKSYTAKTGKDGYYVVKNVEPRTYQALLTRVFNTDSYIFATTGVAGISATEYNVTADKTLFIDPTNLFKVDLKLVNPAAAAKVSAQNLELRWDAYPDAAYYRFSIYPEDVSVTANYINERVEGTSFALDQLLPKGTYRWVVEAYNSNDQKLAESADDIKFTIQ